MTLRIEPPRPVLTIETTQGDAVASFNDVDAVLIEHSTDPHNRLVVEDKLAYVNFSVRFKGGKWVENRWHGAVKGYDDHGKTTRYISDGATNALIDLIMEGFRAQVTPEVIKAAQIYVVERAIYNCDEAIADAQAEINSQKVKRAGLVMELEKMGLTPA